MITRKFIASVLYWTAFVISFGNVLLIGGVQWKLLLEGKALSSFLLPWFIIYAAITFVLWLIAFILNRNWKWTLGCFCSIGIVALLFLFYGVTF